MGDARRDRYPSGMKLRIGVSLSVVLLGIYAGFLVLNHVGIFPAMARMQDASALDFWQSLDTYMARRMPPFILPVIALSLVLALASFREKAGLARYFLLLTVTLLLVDTVHTVTLHLPVNQALQSLALDQPPAEMRGLLARQEGQFMRRAAYVVTAFASDVIALALLPHVSAASR